MHLMQKKKKALWKNTLPILALLLIIGQLFLMVHMGLEKKGFFIDEVWSYGLSNSYFAPKIADLGVYEEDAYVPPEFFEDYLEVMDKDGFQYASVFSNQAHDIHPPLYYCVLHTISSFFPYTFSKWFALIPNYIYYAISAILLFLLGRKLYFNSWIALLPVLIWGCSTQTLSHAVMLRMYMMMCIFSLGDTLLHTDFYLNKQLFTGRDYILLFSLNLLGFLTQYFHYVFAFFLSLFTVSVLLLRKEWKHLFIYSATMLSSVIVSVMIFPGVLTTFTEGRGKKATEIKMTFWKWMYQTIDYIKLWQEKTINGKLKLYCLIIILLSAGMLLNIYRKYKDMKLSVLVADLRVFVPAILFTVFGTFMVITRMAPFTVDRYFYYLTPLGWLVFFFLVDRFGGEYRKILLPAAVFSTIMILSLNFRGDWKSRVMYLFPQQEQYHSVLKDYAGESCLYIVEKGERKYTVTESAPVLSYFSEIKLINIADKPIAEREIHDSDREIIVFIDVLGGNGDTANRIADDVVAATDYTEKELIAKGSGIWREYDEETFVYSIH